MYYLPIHILSALFFIFCSAFFSGAETALFSLSRARLLDYASQSQRKRQCIAQLMDDYQRTLTAIILGNMFMNASLSICINGIVSYFNNSQFASLIISLFISLIILLLGGEVTPKALAILNPEKISDLVAMPIWYYKKIAMPFVLIAEKVHSFLWNLVGRTRQPPLSHNEYYAFLDMAGDIDAFSKSERKILERILDFNELSVSRLVKSRIEVLCINEKMQPDEVEEIIRKSRLKFLPVVKKSIDDAELMLSAKRFFLLGKEKRLSWLQADCCFEAVFIPEQTSLRKALPVFFQKKIPAAFAVDEFGGVTGLLYKKDIYERIFGEIGEEFEKSDWTLIEKSKNNWIIVGNAPIEELKHKIPELSIPDFESSTLNGIVVEVLSDFPQAGQEIQIGNAKIKISKLEKNQINQFELTLSEQNIEEEEI